MSTKTSLGQVDLRVRRTHKLLWEALMAELSERRLDDITVNDICQRAMVHRTTFYKHYPDKYALLEQGMRQLFETLLPDEEHMPPSEYPPEQPPPYFVRLFEHAAQHQQFYRLMLGGEGIGRFQNLVKNYIVEVASARAPHLTSANQLLTRPIAMHAHYVAGATLSLLAWWLANDLPFSPRQMAQYLMSPHGLILSAPIPPWNSFP
jgi:AcrR family transcriptional regulator